MQAWFNFYAVIGAAAATLTGLLFVAMSMNAAAALSKGPHGSRRLAEQAFENYLAVLMVSLLALYPDMTPTTFGRVTLSVVAIWTVLVVVRLYQAAAEPSVHETRAAAMRRHISTLIGFGMLIYAAPGHRRDRHLRHPGRRQYRAAVLGHGEGLGPAQSHRGGEAGGVIGARPQTAKGYSA